MRFNKLFKSKKPLIGMIHLPALPGYPSHPGMDKVIEKALKDLKTLEKAGFDGALVENDNDQPHQIGVNPTIKAAFKLVMIKLVKEAKIPVGMEIIYDMVGTLEVASDVGVKFVRFDIYVDNVETKWGKIPAQAKKLIALRKKLKADNILFLTDIQVKHAKMLENKSLTQSAKEALNIGSDALIVTGVWTGKAPSTQDCEEIKEVVGTTPVLIGSGLDKDNAKRLLSIVDGAIVGTSIKEGEYIDLDKAHTLKNAINSSNYSEWFRH